MRGLVPLVLIGLGAACAGKEPDGDDPLADCANVASAIDVQIGAPPMPLEPLRIDYVVLVPDAEGTPRAVPGEITLEPEVESWDPDDPLDSLITGGSTAAFVAAMTHEPYVVRVTRSGCPDQFVERDVWVAIPEHDGGVTLSDWPSGMPADSAAWSSDGSRLAVAGADPFAILYDGTGSRLDSKRVPAYGGFDHVLVWSPDDRWLAMNGLLFAIEGDELVPFTDLGRDLLGLAFSPDSRFVYASDGLGVFRWDLQTQGSEVLLALPQAVQGGVPVEPVDMAFGPTGLLSVDRYVINPATGLVVQTLGCDGDSGPQDHVRVRLTEDGAGAWIQTNERFCSRQLASGDELANVAHLVFDSTGFALDRSADTVLLTGWEVDGSLVPRTFIAYDLTMDPPEALTFGTTLTEVGQGGARPHLTGAAWSPDGEHVVLTGNLAGNLDGGADAMLGARLLTRAELLALGEGP